MAVPRVATVRPMKVVREAGFRTSRETVTVPIFHYFYINIGVVDPGNERTGS